MSTTRECPSCALPYEGDPDVCPYCGYEFPRQKPGVGLAAVLFVVLLVLGVLWFL